MAKTGVFSKLLAEPDDGTPQGAMLRALLRTTSLIVDEDESTGLALLVGAVVVVAAASPNALAVIQVAIDSVTTGKDLIATKLRSASTPEDQLS